MTDLSAHDEHLELLPARTLLTTFGSGVVGKDAKAEYKDYKDKYYKPEYKDYKEPKPEYKDKYKPEHKENHQYKDQHRK